MIRLENVTKVYPDGTEAVKEVSFEVEAGELCVLLGPSGCGKTTTMKMINRIIPITGGKIYIDDVSNTDMDENELRRNIGYAIQEIGLFPHMTVRQNIETVPILKGWPKDKRNQRAEELIERGQRQRVGVARSLGADPPILLMDEPFGAIDPITRVRLQDEFLKIQREIKKTIIFVTHDIYEAIKMGDKIALMNKGYLVQYDTPANLLYRPVNEFVEDFVGTDRALKGLQLIKVKDVMDGSPPVIRQDEKVESAINRMERDRIDWLAVVDSEAQYLGWVDKAVLGRGKTVSEVMKSTSAAIFIDAVLNEALSLMLSNRLNTLAVVDVDTKLLGALSLDAIQNTLAEVTQKAEPE